MTSDADCPLTIESRLTGLKEFSSLSLLNRHKWNDTLLARADEVIE
jgi:hypothetical protein